MIWLDIEYTPPPPIRYTMPLDVYLREREADRKWRKKEDGRRKLRELEADMKQAGWEV